MGWNSWVGWKFSENPINGVGGNVWVWVGFTSKKKIKTEKVNENLDLSRNKPLFTSNLHLDA